MFVLHGSGGDWVQARSGYAYDFDVLAEAEGFIPVYPDGFEAHWNDCRKAGPYAANTLDVDDVGFFRALVEKLAAEHGADRTRVFATGISNGSRSCAIAARSTFLSPTSSGCWTSSAARATKAATSTRSSHRSCCACAHG